MMQLPKGCTMPGVGKQSSSPGLTKYSAPGLFAPRICEVWDQPHGPSRRRVQRSEIPGTSSSLPRDLAVGVVDLKPRFTPLCVPVA